MTVTLNVNGTDHRVDADPSTPLLYVLRDEKRERGRRGRPLQLVRRHGDMVVHGGRRGGQKGEDSDCDEEGARHVFLQGRWWSAGRLLPARPKR